MTRTGGEGYRGPAWPRPWEELDQATPCAASLLLFQGRLTTKFQEAASVCPEELLGDVRYKQGFNLPRVVQGSSTWRGNKLLMVLPRRKAKKLFATFIEGGKRLRETALALPPPAVNESQVRPCLTRLPSYRAVGT